MVTLIVQVLWSYRQEDRSINQLWVTFWSRLVWLPDRHTDWPPGGRGQQTALAGSSQSTNTTTALVRGGASKQQIKVVDSYGHRTFTNNKRRAPHFIRHHDGPCWGLNKVSHQQLSLDWPGAPPLLTSQTNWHWQAIIPRTPSITNDLSGSLSANSFPSSQK